MVFFGGIPWHLNLKMFLSSTTRVCVVAGGQTQGGFHFAWQSMPFNVKKQKRILIKAFLVSFQSPVTSDAVSMVDIHFLSSVRASLELCWDAGPSSWETNLRFSMHMSLFPTPSLLGPSALFARSTFTTTFTATHCQLNTAYVGMTGTTT